MYFCEISTIQDVTKAKPGTNLFNGGTVRLLLSSDAACINKGKESYFTSMDPSVQCM